MSIREGNEDCKTPRRSLIPRIDNVDEVWNMIITRLPSTAIILREMEEVINDAQKLLQNFGTMMQFPKLDPNKFQSSVINDNDNISLQYNKTLLENNKKNIIDKSMQRIEFGTMTLDHSHKTDSLEEWNQFSCKKVLEPSCPSSVTTFHSPSSSSSSSSLFLNAKSTTTFEQTKGEKPLVNDPLYEIEKVNALDYDSVIKNYESTISITKQATKIIKESAIPTITMKEVMLAPVKPRICAHVSDTAAINNLSQLEIETKQKSVGKSPRQNLSPSALEQASSIPRPILNNSRGMNRKK